MGGGGGKRKRGGVGLGRGFEDGLDEGGGGLGGRVGHGREGGGREGGGREGIVGGACLHFSSSVVALPLTTYTFYSAVLCYNHLGTLSAVDDAARGLHIVLFRL